MASRALLQPAKVGSIEVRNRVIRSSTFENRADETGEASDALCDLMDQLAIGHIGLIMSGHAFVQEIGMAKPRQLGIHSDAMLPSLTRMAERVHKVGGKIGVQLAHAGRMSYEKRVGPSAIEVIAENEDPAKRVPLPTCEALSEAEIDVLVADFGAAARRAVRAGFDAVMVHSAHGYLISQFLSPRYNKRTDAYGGSLENRARLLLRVVEAVKAGVAAEGKPEMPVLVKMNVADFCEGGMTVEESTQVVVKLAKAGVMLIEASGGTFASNFNASRYGEASTEGYHAEGAASWRKALDAAGFGEVLVSLVGGIRTATGAQKFIDDRVCDFVSLSRPLIREPDLVCKWEADFQYRAKCRNCTHSAKFLYSGGTPPMAPCPCEETETGACSK